MIHEENVLCFNFYLLKPHMSDFRVSMLSGGERRRLQLLSVLTKVR